MDFHIKPRLFVQTEEFMDDIQDEDGTRDLPGFFRSMILLSRQR